MTSIYYVKVYVDKPGQTQPEIRRFPIDISPERDTFADLRSKVLPLLSADQQQPFSLQYVDEDNERITFSTDDELRAAVALNKDGNVLKVYVVAMPTATQTNNPQATTSGNTDRHVNVKCDGCNGEVVGFRFKCLVCPDYDLCEQCSAIGKHSEHNMIKITKPGNFQMPGSHFPPPPPPPHHHGLHFPPPPPHHHGHHFQHHHRHGRHPSHHHKRFPPMVPNPDLLQHIQSQIPQWLPKPEQVAHAQAHMKQHLDALKTTAQGHVQNSKEYLQSVGQMLQKALSPLGIDCDYHIEEGGPAASATATESASATTTTTKSNDAEQKEEEKQQDEAAATSPMTSSSSTSSLVEVTADDIIVINGEDIHQESTSQGAVPIIEDLTSEQAIQVCLEKLIAMGFPSNNDHLNELVRSKRGDINGVLDALNNRQ